MEQKQLPKIALGAWAWGNDGTFGGTLTSEELRPVFEAGMKAGLNLWDTAYAYGMSAQLKILVDRFCAFNSSLTAGRKKSALIAAAWNSDSWTFDALEAHYNTLVCYLSLQDQGTILGRGCGTPAMTRGSRFMQEAYALGRNLQ